MQNISLCSLLFCTNQVKSQQETEQEQFSFNYSQEMSQKIPQMIPTQHVLSPSSKEIFSFKYNCFRNMPTSEKPQSQHVKQAVKLPETQVKLKCCRSSEKNSLKLVQSPNKNYQIQRYFCSPPRKVELSVATTNKVSVKTSTIYPSHTQMSHQTSIPPSMSSDSYQSQADGKSKNSEQTNYSWKKSQTRKFYEQPSMGIRMPQVNQFEGGQWRQGDWPIKTQKYHSKAPSLASVEGSQTERTLIDQLKEECRYESIQKDFNRNSYDRVTSRQTIKFSQFLPREQHPVPLKNHTSIVKLPHDQQFQHHFEPGFKKIVIL